LSYAKAILAALIAAGAAIATGLDDNTLTWSEWITVALATLGSGGIVWYVANGAGAQYAKAVVAALTAALTSLAVAVDDNAITSQEWTTALVAAAVALAGIWAVPNTPQAPSDIGDAPIDA
jgi:hypothetical protein